MTKPSDTITADLDQVQLFDPGFQQCPHVYYATMRQTAPVFHVAGTNIYLITRDEDCRAALRDVETFSSKMAGNRVSTAMGTGNSVELEKKINEILADGFPIPRTLVTNDPPSHTRYRRLVARAFTAGRVNSWRQRIEQITAELVHKFVFDGEVEFVSQFADRLPVRVITEFLGIPPEREADVKRWSDASSASIGANLSDEEWLDSYRSVVESQHYLSELLHERMNNPRDDFLTDLINARIDDDDLNDKRPLDMHELVGVVHQLMVAGNGTTTMALSEAMRLLAERADVMTQVRHDPPYAQRVADEVLRLAAPAQGMFRIVTRDTELSGVAIPAGALAVLMYSSANRDDASFTDPNALNPDRENVRDHLSFGQGIHACLGQSLARMELEIAIAEICRRLTNVRIVQDGELQYLASFILRGLIALPLRFDRLLPNGCEDSRADDEEQDGLGVAVYGGSHAGTRDAEK